MGGGVADGSSTGAEYSLRIVWSLARWVEDTRGRAALAELASLAGVTVEDFDGTTCWISGAQFETILAEGRRIAGDEATFHVALVHRFKESYGAFQHMVWSVSLERMGYLAVMMTNKVISRVGHCEAVASTRSSFQFKYTSPNDTELMCLSRKLAWRQVPTLHGLPPAEIIELKCMARGDDCCEYHVKWVDARAFRSVSIGLGIGLVAALVAHGLQQPVLVSVVLTLLGAAAGYAAELRRIARLCVHKAEDAARELRALGEAEAETRSELFAHQQRLDAWNARMEEEASERDATLDRVVKGLEGLQRSRATSIRGFSHDLRNPLFVVRANARLLRESIEAVGEDAEILDDIESASSQIENLLGQLMDVASTDNVTTKLAPQEITVAPLADVLRRRLRALVYGRGIEVTVDAAADAPASVLVDRLVFDRVVDNLLTNAAKYTDRGTIHLTLRGARDGLVFELVDTGRGIEKSRIAEIFKPRSAAEPREPNSYGVGLSSAIRLLHQIGGDLDVSSIVGQGSTFRARFPLRPPTQKPETGAEDDIDGVIANVVTVYSGVPRVSAR